MPVSKSRLMEVVADEAAKIVHSRTMIPYLKTFFGEKHLKTRMWELQDSEGTTHFLGTDNVIEHIGLASAAEQNKIADMIRKIDFVNGDVNKYLKHLARGLIN